MKFDLPVANKQSPSFIATRLTLGTTPELLISHANSKNISFSSHFLIYFLNFESYWDFQANTLRYMSVLKNHFKLSSSLYWCLNLNSVTLQTKSTSDQVKPTNIGIFWTLRATQFVSKLYFASRNKSYLTIFFIQIAADFELLEWYIWFAH